MAQKRVKNKVTNNNINITANTNVKGNQGSSLEDMVNRARPDDKSVKFLQDNMLTLSFDNKEGSDTFGKCSVCYGTYRLFPLWFDDVVSAVNYVKEHPVHLILCLYGVFRDLEMKSQQESQKTEDDGKES